MNIESSLYPKTYAVTLEEVHALFYYPKANLVTLEDFPESVQNALCSVGEPGTPQWLEILFQMGGSEERWDIIVRALGALTVHQYHRLNLGKCLAKQGIGPNHPLAGLAQDTIALFAEGYSHASPRFSAPIW